MDEVDGRRAVVSSDGQVSRTPPPLAILFVELPRRTCVSDLKLQAELLRIGILGGYVSPEEAVAWADALIETSVSARADLIEVSLSGGKRGEDVAHALAQVVGEVGEEELRHAFLRHMADVVFSQPAKGRNVARTLYRLALEGGAPTWEAESAMLTFDDAYDLAESGIFSTPEGVAEELREFLAEWRPGQA